MIQSENPSATDAGDLPDIIDVVMEMGVVQAKAPSPPLSAQLEKLAGRARDYVEAASSANTRRAYAADWKHFCAWCRRQNLEATPPDPQTVGLYITACASGTVTGDKKPNSVSTIERRLSSLSWNYTQRGQPLVIRIPESLQRAHEFIKGGADCFDIATVQIITGLGFNVFHNFLQNKISTTQ